MCVLSLVYSQEAPPIHWKTTTDTPEWNSDSSVKSFIGTNGIWNMVGSLRQNVRGSSLKSASCNNSGQTMHVDRFVQCF